MLWMSMESNSKNSLVILRLQLLQENVSAALRS